MEKAPPLVRSGNIDKRRHLVEGLEDLEMGMQQGLFSSCMSTGDGEVGNVLGSNPLLGKTHAIRHAPKKASSITDFVNDAGVGAHQSKVEHLGITVSGCTRSGNPEATYSLHGDILEGAGDIGKVAMLHLNMGLQVTYCIHHQFGSEGDPKSLEALDLGDVVRHCGRR